MASCGVLPWAARRASHSGSRTIRARPLIRRVSSLPGTRKMSPMRGFSSSLRMPSKRLLAGRSGMSRVWSSTTRTKPGASPLGLTSQRPVRSAVATRRKGARAMKARQCSSIRPMSLRSAISEGSPISARSSSRVATTSLNSVTSFAPLMRRLREGSLVYPKIPSAVLLHPFPVKAGDCYGLYPEPISGEEPTPVPPREEVITVGQTKVQVVIGGQGDPLVVLHGAGGNRGWRRWMAAVGERYTVYAPTHPGFGRSDAADWMESIDDLARFYLWFLDVMGFSKVHLLGHSIGGWTAAELATMRPGAIDRLVLVSPTGLKPDEGEIRDIFFYSPEELLQYNVHDRATVPEWAELFGQKPGPAEIEVALRNREMAARLTSKP